MTKSRWEGPVKLHNSDCITAKVVAVASAKSCFVEESKNQVSLRVGL